MSPLRARATVLMYHRLSLSPVEIGEGDYALPPEEFERQMELLASEKRPVVALTDLAAGSFPDRSVALTFDDGCDTDSTVALPRLRRLRFPAAFFVNPARLGEPGRLTWRQLEGLAAAGMRIGSHGFDHALLDGLPLGELERQLAASKTLLEERLGTEIDALSLPGGTGGRRALRVARGLGYHLVLGSAPGLVTSGAPRPILPRYPVRRGCPVAAFRALVEQRLRFRLGQTVRYGALRLLRAGLGPSTYVRWRESRLRRRNRSHRPAGTA